MVNMIIWTVPRHTHVSPGWSSATRPKCCNICAQTRAAESEVWASGVSSIWVHTCMKCIRLVHHTAVRSPAHGACAFKPPVFGTLWHTCTKQNILFVVQLHIVQLFLLFSAQSTYVFTIIHIHAHVEKMPASQSNGPATHSTHTPTPRHTPMCMPHIYTMWPAFVCRTVSEIQERGDQDKRSR